MSERSRFWIRDRIAGLLATGEEVVSSSSVTVPRHLGGRVEETERHGADLGFAGQAREMDGVVAAGPLNAG